MSNSSIPPDAPKKLLVADDDPAIGDALKIMLEDEGYRVDVTGDGAVLYETRDCLPDLVLLDIWMAGLDGGDICRHLKSQSDMKHIPVIMVSANRDTEKIAREAGADDFLLKPFDIDDLMNLVSKYV